MNHDPYGLSDRPFQLTPDPRFYYDSATHRKAMTYLEFGLAQREGFIVITGEVGTGKTMLVGRLMASIDHSRLTAINLVSTQLEGGDILRVAAAALGIATDQAAKGLLLAQIERFLHEQVRTDRRTLLIVDEAQNLPMSALEELRMLSNFQFGGQSLLQIVLLGQPEFREALAQPRFEQLRQRVIATHHLTAMSADEVAPYIMHRLSCAGWKGTPRFSQDAYEAFYRLSDGIPRRLNVLAGRVMLQGAAQRLTDIDAQVVENVAAALSNERIIPAAAASPFGRAMRYDRYDRATAEAIARGESVPATPAPFQGGHDFAGLDEAPPRPLTSFSVEDVPIATARADDVPPPVIEQPPRYDGASPVPVAPLTPPIPAGRPAFAVEESPPPDEAPPADSPSASPPAAAPDSVDLAARNAELEALLAEQEAMLRRTLSLLEELVATEPLPPDDPRDNGREDAA